MSQTSRSSTARPLRIVMAGGGTGGHLFPGLAIAQEFVARNAASRILFLGTGNPLERSVLSNTDFTLACIRVEGIKGRGLWRQARSVFKLPGAVVESMRILKDFGPDLVIGLGSYSAGPVVLGAWLRGIKCVLQEQNILPGITNRMLARFAARIYVAFEGTQTRFDQKKVRLTGNPVRREIIDHARRSGDDSHRRAAGQPFTVLVLGGSQGAHRINQAVIEALEHLREKKNLRFIHQTGAADEQMVAAAYARQAVAGRVQAFFSRMAELYRQADLIICRAGATTVAEITISGKAAIFIPFPFAADDHQTLNARALSQSGAAELILEKDLDARILAARIDDLASHPRRLEDMAAAAARLGRPDAARAIVDDCYELVGGH